MSIHGKANLARRAFTLLEVMVAVLIIAMLVVCVYRFVRSVLVAVNAGTQSAVAKQEMEGFMNFLQLELADLPIKQQGVLAGTPHKYNNLPADELEWVCPSGHGVLTTSAPDTYRVTLAIQNVKGKNNEYEIGLRRRSVDADEKNYNWLPLLHPAVALEVRYFEPRGKQWIEAWQDPVLRPSLVRVRIWRSKDAPPYETIIPLPTARLQTI